MTVHVDAQGISDAANGGGIYGNPIQAPQDLDIKEGEPVFRTASDRTRGSQSGKAFGRTILNGLFTSIEQQVAILDLNQEDTHAVIEDLVFRQITILGIASKAYGTSERKAGQGFTTAVSGVHQVLIIDEIAPGQGVEAALPPIDINERKKMYTRNGTGSSKATLVGRRAQKGSIGKHAILHLRTHIRNPTLGKKLRQAKLNAQGIVFADSMIRLIGLVRDLTLYHYLRAGLVLPSASFLQAGNVGNEDQDRDRDLALMVNFLSGESLGNIGVVSSGVRIPLRGVAGDQGRAEVRGASDAILAGITIDANNTEAELGEGDGRTPEGGLDTRTPLGQFMSAQYTGIPLAVNAMEEIIFDRLGRHLGSSIQAKKPGHNVLINVGGSKY